MNRASGATLRCSPWQRRGKRVVDFENAGRMTETLQTASVTSWKFLCGNSGELPAGRIKQNRARLFHLGEIFDPGISFDFSAQLKQVGRERIADRLRAALRQRPADRMTGGAQNEPERG